MIAEPSTHVLLACVHLPTATSRADALSHDLRTFSARLTTLVRSLRVLDAVRWAREVEDDFFSRGACELPRVGPDYYERRPLPFEPASTQNGLINLERAIVRRLGREHAASRLLLPRCREARKVVDLLAARGTPRFAAVSRRLYGSSRDPLPVGSPSLNDLADRLGAAASAALDDPELAPESHEMDATTAAHLLSARLGAYFGGDPAVKVIVTDDMDASASVGGDCLKVRRDARFCARDIRLLEVHEGWVHLGTSRNARQQSALDFLGRPLPLATRTQEGLAVWTEVLTFASHPARLRLLAARVEGVALAEQGANFLEVYRHYLGQGFSPREAYQQSSRVFRGSLPTAGPFTKDLSYAHGFAEVGHFLTQAVTAGAMRLVPLLFCGKVSVRDLPALAELRVAGLVQSPIHVPQPFADLRALAALVCCLGCFPPAG